MIAAGLTDEERREIAAYYSSIPFKKMVRVVESETQRLMLGSVLADLSSTAGDLPLTPAAAEAALARLYEEPLETAAGPTRESRARDFT